MNRLTILSDVVESMVKHGYSKQEIVEIFVFMGMTTEQTEHALYVAEKWGVFNKN
ncbi:hypothetical protein P9Y62_28855 [Bacillus thuringiensis]|uniref:hypothetical protein n=1 Tax=Bacillus thuringiensis TaxID=1428 RepID=UPI0001A1AC0D|nr:hypothetical protein [Bacillus thuringiensis]EEM37657.1 hypothetical protein bthur0004_65430 [Bacillus thuringiensis serovar sotto str. T04001]MEB4894870.1 hypothetical protein [Bacillus thuringiensis]MEC2565603.1 hypothetical protein [Bacillus thuringiensis]MEC2643363.1 hypothetical protein [Bacillus thuringiensis]MEC2727812.1 hypothetical protein [Bacillus thuringiensis]